MYHIARDYVGGPEEKSFFLKRPAQRICSLRDYYADDIFSLSFTTRINCPGLSINAGVLYGKVWRRRRRSMVRITAFRFVGNGARCGVKLVKYTVHVAYYVYGVFQKEKKTETFDISLTEKCKFSIEYRINIKNIVKSPKYKDIIIYPLDGIHLFL